MRHCGIICGDVPDTCPRAPCVHCKIDLRERAGHVAHHLGLAHPPLSCDEAMVLARAQALASMPGQQHTLRQ